MKRYNAELPLPTKVVPYKKRIKYSPKLSKKYTKNDLFIRKMVHDEDKAWLLTV